MDKELLSSGLERIGITPSDELIGKIQLYLDEILFFNPSLKLVGAEDADEIIIKHVLDSAAAYPVFLENTEASSVIADMGSGAGFPGVVLAMLFPDRDFVLIERMQRRSRFLKGVLARTGLKNAEVCDCDIKDAERSFDAVTCRAFHPIYDAADEVYPLLEEGAPLLLYKGPRVSVSSELDVLRGEGWSFEEEIVNLKVPYLDEARTMAVLRKLRRI